MAPFVVATIVLAGVAAVRSTWSPCGLSMLSSMTPLAERTRGHRFWVTAVLYALGACAGGATVGSVLAAGAAVVGAVGVSDTVVIAAVVVTALVTGAADLRIGPDVPRHRRQVDEDWFSGYRRWVYATGFGWQIGNGFATYTTTAALHAVAVAAVVGGDWRFAFAVGLGFGTLRGLAIVLAVPLTSIDAVRRTHARLDRWAERSRILTGATQVTAAIVLALTLHVGVAAASALVVAAAALRARATAPSGGPVPAASSAR